jgi:hypothetical protein
MPMKLLQGFHTGITQEIILQSHTKAMKLDKEEAEKMEL